jgi:TrmH family RNA methyltransferase
MGTLLRTAEAAGADGVLLTPGTVDAFSPKVVRAGMGAHFHLPILHLPWEAIHTALKGLPVYLAESEGGIPLWEVDFQQPCTLLVGGEAFGASKFGAEIATHRVTIPMQGRAESLNAAVAASILMAEVLRQRYQQKKG